MLETPLYVGAYNHFDLDGFISHLKMVKWDEPENVKVMVQGQHSEKFKIIELV